MFAGQTAPDTQKVKELFEQEHWQEVVDAAGRLPSPNADLEFFYGSALAQLGRLDQARAVFLAGRRLQPRDKRFPTELAGVTYKQKKYSEAVSWLQRALRIDPHDEYANDFLATIYFLNGNLEAALKYWNRVGKPQIENVRPEQRLRIDPALLDRAFAFSPAGELRLPDLLTSKARVTGLGVFPVFSFQLAARENGKFDVGFRAQERNGFGNNKWEALLSTFRGAFYQTVYPEYFNLERSAINISSLVRWDAQKRRLMAGLSAPLERNPKYRYAFGIDLRNENWDVRSSFQGIAPLLGGLNLRREAVSGGINSFNSGRWSWYMGGEFSHRDYRDVLPGTALPPRVLLPGYQLKHLAHLNYELLRVPEKRLESSLRIFSQVGSIWADRTHTFEKLQSSLSGHWLPQLQGDDYEMVGQLGAGKIFGSAPFDELFMLGLERDNDLWLRAHIGTRDGRKGSSPLGQGYFLSNWEVNKNVYNNGFFGVKLSPFLDSGRITNSLQGAAVNRWLWDTGLQAKARVLGVGVTFTYGKDLRSGNNAFYVTALQ